MRKKLPEKWCLKLTEENFREILNKVCNAPTGFHCYDNIFRSTVGDDFIEISFEEYKALFCKNKKIFKKSGYKLTLPNKFLEDLLITEMKKQNPPDVDIFEMDADKNFNWSNSNQGHNFWDELFYFIQTGATELPLIVKTAYPKQLLEKGGKIPLTNFDLLKQGACIELSFPPPLWSGVKGNNPKNLPFPHTFEIEEVVKDSFSNVHILTKNGYGLFVDKNNFGGLYFVNN